MFECQRDSADLIDGRMRKIRVDLNALETRFKVREQTSKANSIIANIV